MLFQRPKIKAKHLVVLVAMQMLWFSVPVHGQVRAIFEQSAQTSQTPVLQTNFQHDTGPIASVSASPVYPMYEPVYGEAPYAQGGPAVWTDDGQGYGESYYSDDWSWQILPDGLIWHNYMASVNESRLAGVVHSDPSGDSIFDVALGGRVGVLRFGSTNTDKPEGWQFDMEGAAFPRLNLSQNWDVEATDFRFGLPVTYGCGPWQYKFSYYHLSSHMGDEYAIRNPGALASRINYSRDALVLASSYYFNPAIRLYSEASWAFHYDGGNKPWEFQFGIDYAQPGRTDIFGTPFVAVNGYIREALDYGGNFVAQAGWLWRGDSGRTLRMGFQYYNGKSNQFEFFDRTEEQAGFGIWYDQ